MSGQDGDSPVGDLVAERPARAPVLDALGIDYASRGQRTLTEACAEIGLDPDDVARALDERPPPAATCPSLVAASIPEIIDHIVAVHHREARRSVVRLVPLAQGAAQADGWRHPELIEVSDIVAEIATHLEPHLDQEETELFPACRRLSAHAPSDGAPSTRLGAMVRQVRGLLDFHDQATEELHQLAQVTHGFAVPADASTVHRLLLERLAAFTADSNLHLHEENNVLFPAVLALCAGLG